MSALSVVLVANDLGAIPEFVPRDLQGAGVDFRETLCTTSDHVPAAAAEADLVWVMGGSPVVSGAALETLPRCRVLLRTGTGTDNVPVAVATRLGVYVANTPEATTHAVAEHALGLLFAVARQIAAQDRLIRQGVWDRGAAWPSHSFEGRTLGLVGFGRIARALVRKASGLGLRAVAADPGVDAAAMGACGVEKVELDDVCRRADYISVHTPLLAGTRGLVGEPQFRLMKPTAILVNTSRGPVVDQRALTAALREKRLAGAGLDVVEQEPLAADDPLREFPEVVLTPHIASYSDEFHFNFWSHSVRTIVAVAETGRPLWIVNPEVRPR
jgi:D-3-phosphoglycerate dehydrogenase